MSRNIVFEGWLTKSPPAKRVWRAKWRKRWFSLRQSGELPGQYVLDYYADRNSRRLKGTINLDLCEQVDAGLHMNRGALEPNIRGCVFALRTQSRVYHLEAECQADMEKWVDTICRVCGLRSSDDRINVIEPYQVNIRAVSNNSQNDRTGPYIPISECITGTRMQEAFTFDPENIVTSARTFERVPGNKCKMYTSQPHIRSNAEFSENDSALSDEDCKSLNASQSNIDWSVAETFTKMSISNNQNGYSLDGPPVPPRPPKTLLNSKETFQGPRIQEPEELGDHNTHERCSPWPRNSRRISVGNSPTSPSRYGNTLRYTDDEDENTVGHPSLQYFNISMMPPAVDRALKPRQSQQYDQNFPHPSYYSKSDALQYLALDLHTAKPTTSRMKPLEMPRKPYIVHEKSLSAVDDMDSSYKSVDFIKTEAFNKTRKDAEASRNTHH